MEVALSPRSHLITSARVERVYIDWNAHPIALVSSQSRMSDNNDIHPDLQRFYEALAAEEEEDGEFYPDLDDDEEDGDDYDLYLDAEDMDEEIDGVYDEHGMIIPGDEDEDEEDDDEGGEEDEDMIIDEEDDEDEDDDGAGAQWLNIAALLNSAGDSVQARSSLLARLLAGPGPAAGTRSGGVRLTSMMSAEDRARQIAERRKRERWWKPQVEPHPNGLRLLRSGEFGRVGGQYRRRKGLRIPSRREYICTRAQVSPLIGNPFAQLTFQATVPNSHGTVVAS